MTILDERGFFWWSSEPIPEGQFAPISCAPGALRIQDDGQASLDLDGTLPSKRGPMAALARDDIPKDQMICGILKSSNRRVMLIDLVRNGGGFSNGGMSYEGFLATQCLVADGTLPNEASDIKFTRLDVPLTGFEEWLRLGSIEMKRSRRTITAKYKNPKTAQYPTVDGRLSIRFSLQEKSSGPMLSGGLSMKQIASASFIFKKTIDVDAVQEEYRLFQDLFILLTDSDYSLDWPWLWTDKDTRCRFYFWRVANTASAKPPRFHECWTNFVQLRDTFGEIWSSWKKKREEVGPGIYLYLGTKRGISLYLEHKFVNLVWGLEAYHRKQDEVGAQPTALKRKIDRIVGQVELPKDKKWLEKRLANAHEPSLEERIFDVLSSVPLGLERARLRSFAKECAELRNDISHFGGQRHQGEYSDFLERLQKSSAALDVLYHAVLLHEVGVSEKIIEWQIYNGFHSYVTKSNFVEVGLLKKDTANMKRATKAKPEKKQVGSGKASQAPADERK